SGKSDVFAASMFIDSSNLSCFFACPRRLGLSASRRLAQWGVGQLADRPAVTGKLEVRVLPPQFQPPVTGVIRTITTPCAGTVAENRPVNAPRSLWAHRSRTRAGPVSPIALHDVAITVCNPDRLSSTTA